MAGGSGTTAPERSLVQTKITTREQWEALPVGTLVGVQYFEAGDRDEAEDTMHVLRVADNALSAVGDYRLAGGKHWSDIWEYQQGVTVQISTRQNALSPEAAATREEAIMQGILAGKEGYFEHQYAWERYRRLSGEERIQAGPPHAQGVWVWVIDKLLELGWEPPVKVPEGVQVWTVTGAPAENPRSDGTMAYLSLPRPENWLEVEDRGDIWLENPVVTVIGERPRKNVA